MRLSVNNNLAGLSSTPYTFTGVALTAGGTAIGVKNTSQLTNQYAIQLGKTGEEQSEILTISGAPSGPCK